MKSILELVTILCAAFFAGGALYISKVEHPARMSDPEIAIRQFRQSYPRAAPWQASTAAICFILSLFLTWITGNRAWAAGGLLVGSVIPFTFIAIFPTNKRILDPAAVLTSDETAALLWRWGMLHWIRSILGTIGLFVLIAAVH